jgi:flagellar protein FlbD
MMFRTRRVLKKIERKSPYGEKRPPARGYERFERISGIQGYGVIKVSRLNGTEYWLNPHMIETIERTPDTTITLVTGKKLVVREKPDTVLEEIIQYRKNLGTLGNEQ